MYDFDHPLFLALNFDGGETFDKIMNTVSGTPMWIPLYLLILWLVCRRYGWRMTLLFVVLMVGSIVLSDMIAGIFKHNGMLGGLLPDFEPRLRPMFTASLEEMNLPDSTFIHLRYAGEIPAPVVHTTPEALGGLYGTVSAHASTIVTLSLLAAGVIRKHWFSLVMLAATLLICYSRIYLAKHFPMDLLWGSLVGIACGAAALCIFRAVARKRPETRDTASC